MRGIQRAGIELVQFIEPVVADDAELQELRHGLQRQQASQAHDRGHVCGRVGFPQSGFRASRRPDRWSQGDQRPSTSVGVGARWQMTVTSLPSQEPSRAALIKRLGAFSMRSQREGDVHTINVIGEMDVASTGDVEQLLIDVEASDACVIFVDLSTVTFMDSTAIKMLVCAHGRSRDNGNRLALRRPPDSVRRVLDICGVDGLLPFTD